VRLGTCLPGDESAQVAGVFDIRKATAALSAAGIRGCLTNFGNESAAWERSTQELGRALADAGVTLLEYNMPFFIQTETRERCAADADRTVRLLELAESIRCLNVVTCVDGPNGIHGHPDARNPCRRTVLIDTCRRIAEAAGQRGLRARLCLELVYTTVTWSPRVLAELVDEVGSPNVQGHMDLVNCLTFDNLFDHTQLCREAFATLAGRFHSAHLKGVGPAESYLAGLAEMQVDRGYLDLRTYLKCLGALPPTFPAIIEHLAALPDIVRSYRYVKAMAVESGIPTWAE
jgi:sugar phosphate isomerase/epimerase